MREKQKEIRGRRGGDDVPKEAETGVMWPRVKVCWQPLEVMEETRDGFFPRASKGAWPH